jgi:hypothetical protein
MENILRAGTLKISIAKEALYVVVFSALAVYTPYIVHIFGGAEAGKIFLPMPFFVLLAGLLLGWRAGLATAIVAPIVSYLLSGMPTVDFLPFILIQLVVFGVLAGILRKKYGIFVSLALAIIAGWLATGMSLFIFSKMNAIGYIVSGIRAGSPGIISQFVILPIVINFLNRHSKDEK